VGAGDSFLGTLLAGLLSGQPRADALEEACAMGALVASRTGANPIISQKELTEFLSKTKNT
jgi:fructokinase